jgi:hypothetical protein
MQLNVTCLIKRHVPIFYVIIRLNICNIRQERNAKMPCCLEIKVSFPADRHCVAVKRIVTITVKTVKWLKETLSLTT